MSIRILHGDARDVLKTLPSGSVQTCITSPPYWGLRQYLPDGHPDMAKQIGLEASPDVYVAEMVAVFREVRRVLRDDGTLWLNLGDAYVSNGRYDVTYEKKMGRQGIHRNDVEKYADRDPRPAAKAAGLKVKDLIGLPWMVAFALRADGWYLRQDNIWAKRNCMPESVRDRTTRAHEYVFMLTKQSRYFYDAVAIEEEGDIPAGTRAAKGSAARSDLKHVNGRPPEYYEYTGKRNKRSVWHVATQPFAEAHFATMPPAIVETCVLAGTSEKGCCSACGAPWVRQTEKRDTGKTQKMTDGWDTGPGGHGTIHRSGREKGAAGVPVTVDVTVGWLPSCECGADVVPCTVLDPFGGAGTTGMVADRLGRDAVLIELNPEYIEITKRRMTKDAGMFAEITAR